LFWDKFSECGQEEILVYIQGFDPYKKKKNNDEPLSRGQALLFMMNGQRSHSPIGSLSKHQQGENAEKK
jgi:hypothetical protein